MVGAAVLTAEQQKLLQEESEIRSRVQNIQKDVQAVLNALSGLAKAVSASHNRNIIIPESLENIFFGAAPGICWLQSRFYFHFYFVKLSSFEVIIPPFLFRPPSLSLGSIHHAQPPSRDDCDLQALVTLFCFP